MVTTGQNDAPVALWKMLIELLVTVISRGCVEVLFFSPQF
jgi:hypothetical protein